MKYNKAPRVTDIVWYKYPFDPKFFHLWLKDKNIDPDVYMDVAQSGGTLVHECMEDWLLQKKDMKEIIEKAGEYMPWAMAWIQFTMDYKLWNPECEKYVRCKYYQGTADCVIKIDWKDYILDWKTFWLAKWKLVEQKINPPKKDKLEKVALQLSLYAKILKIENIAAVHLTPEWYQFYDLEVWSDEDIKNLIKEYRVVNWLYKPKN